MKKLFLVLITMCLMSCNSDEKKDASQAALKDNEAYQTIMTRTSVRDYDQSKQVTDQQIEAMLRAAMAAPSAVNKQPWEFVVVKDKKVLNALGEASPNMKMVEKASCAIVVCGNMERTLPDDGHDYWIQDCSAASENLLLAAHAQGLGAVWCGVYPIADRISQVSEILALPDEVVPLNVISIGYPASEHQPKEKWDAAKVHYDKF